MANSTRRQTEFDFSSTDFIKAVLPGPTYKRLPKEYSFRLCHQSDDPEASGCVLLWQVEGGRQLYQIALEREDSGLLRWHCTCADAVYRGENSPYKCKHVRGLLSYGRAAAMKFDTTGLGVRRTG